MQNRTVKNNKEKIISEQPREKMSRTVRKMIDAKSSSKNIVSELHSQLKMLEFNDIKTLEATRLALSLITLKIKDRLKDTNLSNKQKAEIMVVAQLEAHSVVDALVSSIENLNNYN